MRKRQIKGSAVRPPPPTSLICWLCSSIMNAFAVAIASFCDFFYPPRNVHMKYGSRKLEQCSAAIPYITTVAIGIWRNDACAVLVAASMPFFLHSFRHCVFLAPKALAIELSWFSTCIWRTDYIRNKSLDALTIWQCERDEVPLNAVPTTNWRQRIMSFAGQSFFSFWINNVLSFIELKFILYMVRSFRIIALPLLLSFMASNGCSARVWVCAIPMEMVTA